MTTFRSLKSVLRPWLKNPDWSGRAPLPPEFTGPRVKPLSLVNPLFACLAEGGETAERAALALGGVVADLFRRSPEDARTVMRRFLWQMNEESGNIGWGIPLAFGAVLARSRPLADEYHSLLFHYIHDKDGDNTFCDHAPLRRECYVGIGMVLDARPDLAADALPLLRRAVEREDDETCRALARDLLRKFAS